MEKSAWCENKKLITAGLIVPLRNRYWQICLECGSVWIRDLDYWMYGNRFLESFQMWIGIRKLLKCFKVWNANCLGQK